MDQDVTDIDGKPVSLKSYRGKALLIVNVASECGNTPQYTDLEKLYERYKDRGLVVLGFPSNEFGGQEPGSDAEIKKFAHEEYGVTFPLFSKIKTNGPDACPLYQAHTGDSGAATKGKVTWNFAKFLVDPQGRVVARFAPKTQPLDAELVAAVEAVLPR